MKRLSLVIPTFTIFSLIFFILLILLRKDFLAYPLISYQDMADLLTPLILIPIYWLLFRTAAGRPASLVEEICFMIFAALWVEGQSIHLSANAIDNLIGNLAQTKGIDITGTDIFRLTYFFDEHLGHYLWHLGILGLTGLLVYRECCSPVGQKTNWWVTLLAGAIYGFTYFCVFLEGQTVVLGLPFALLVVLLVLSFRRKSLGQQPVMAFFFLACLVAVMLFTGWGIYWQSLPQFSEVGLI